MEKTLSISIAAYNVEKFIKDTLNSLVSPEIMDDIEVLLVDDGSKDHTAAIGREFEEQYPGSFKVISKPNGGYGSTINAAMDVATGKYFKTLDGDDWYDTENFVKFVKALKDIETDLVITPFTSVHEVTGEKEITKCDVTYGKDAVLFEQLPKEIYPNIRMHSVAYKTKLLKENNIRIAEHCFYTDIEYITFPMMYVHNVCFLDYSVYQYRIGLEGQSVSMEGFRKHYKDHLRVVDRVLKLYLESKKQGMSKEKNVYMFRILKDLVNTQYTIFFIMENTKQIKQELVDFDNKIKAECHILYEVTGGKKTKLLRKTNFALFGTLGLYSKLKK